MKVDFLCAGRLSVEAAGAEPSLGSSTRGLETEEDFVEEGGNHCANDGPNKVNLKEMKKNIYHFFKIKLNLPEMCQS